MIARRSGAVSVELGRPDPLHPLEGGQARRSGGRDRGEGLVGRRRRRPASAPPGHGPSARHGAHRTAGPRRTSVAVGPWWVPEAGRDRPAADRDALGAEPGEESAPLPARLAAAGLPSIGPRQVEPAAGPGDPDVQQPPLLGDRRLVVERLADRQRARPRASAGRRRPTRGPSPGGRSGGSRRRSRPSRSWRGAPLQLRADLRLTRGRDRRRIDLVDDREDRLERGRLARGPRRRVGRPARRRRVPERSWPELVRNAARIADASARPAASRLEIADRAIAASTSGRS